MKKITLPLLALCLTIISCKKDSTPTPPGGGAGGATLTAENYGFDGSTSAGKFSSTAAGITKSSQLGMTIFAISGIRDGGKESISILIHHDITSTGTYKFNSSSSDGGIIITKDYTNPGDLAKTYKTSYDGASVTGGGEVNITKLDGNYVEGTFYAVMFNTSKSTAFLEQGAFKGTIH